MGQSWSRLRRIPLCWQTGRKSLRRIACSQLNPCLYSAREAVRRKVALRLHTVNVKACMPHHPCTWILLHVACRVGSHPCTTVQRCIRRRSQPPRTRGSVCFSNWNPGPSETANPRRFVSSMTSAKGAPRGGTDKYESACASSKSTTRCRASAGITKAQLAKRPYAPPVRVTCAE